jgi:hypothetical protein
MTPVPPLEPLRAVSSDLFDFMACWKHVCRPHSVRHYTSCRLPLSRHWRGHAKTVGVAVRLKVMFSNFSGKAFSPGPCWFASARRPSVADSRPKGAQWTEHSEKNPPLRRRSKGNRLQRGPYAPENPSQPFGDRGVLPRTAGAECKARFCGPNITAAECQTAGCRFGLPARSLPPAQRARAPRAPPAKIRGPRPGFGFPR